MNRGLAHWGQLLIGTGTRIEMHRRQIGSSMTPQDPNFPEEIPPVPPPRHGQDTEAVAGQPDGPSSLDDFDGTDESWGIPADSSIAAAARLDALGAVDAPSLGPTTSGERNGSDGDGPSDRRTKAESSGDRPSDSALAANAPSPNQPPSRLSPENDRRPLNALPTEPVPAAQALTTDATPASEWPIAQTYRSPRAVPPLEDVWADTDVPYQPKELGVVDQVLLWLADGVTLWKRFLRWVRSQLPPNLQLSDGLLTAIALGLLILCLALWNPLGSGRSSRAVATPAPLPRLEVEETSFEAEAPSPLPATELTEPPTLEAAQPPAPSPEQSLIADIQDRVSAISRSYGVGLIQSVEVNLPANTLGVNLAEAWYGLLTGQQNEIAQDIYQQAQGLNFSTLQLRDPDGVVVARNPVVGTTMVVLRRMRSAEAS